jgi:hypothetical protein
LRQDFVPQHAWHSLIADDHRQRFAARFQFPDGLQRLLS